MGAIVEALNRIQAARAVETSGDESPLAVAEPAHRYCQLNSGSADWQHEKVNAQLPTSLFSF